MPTRLHVAQGRFRNEAGWLVPFLFSEFEAIWLLMTGREAQYRAECERTVEARRNGQRWFGMWATQPVIKFNPTMQGYWAAMERGLDIAAEYGLYVEIAFFCDAQIIVPSDSERRAWLRQFIDVCKRHSNAVPQIANEPFKNGWSEADADSLLELATIVRSSYDGAFSVGDPQDIANEGNGEPLASKWERIAEAGGEQCYLVLHSDRSDSNDGRFRRWLDHLKGAHDAVEIVEDRIGRPVAFLSDENKGACSCAVMEANNWQGRRDCSVVAHVAAACIGAMMGGYTYMHRSDEDEAAPGLLESAIAAEIPGGPNGKFINATLTGSPVTSFTSFDGGKVRTWTNGTDAWAVAYGKSGGTLVWRSDWTPTLRAEIKEPGALVQVWQAK